jgi:predicted ATPase
VDAWRALAVRSLITFYDAVLARLLIAAGRLDQARDRIQIALQLADETGMHFYDAELLRIRAHSTDDPGARRADISDAIELARSQGALVFELRSALEYFALEGEPGRDALLDVVSRFPADISWPQLTHARALLA